MPLFLVRRGQNSNPFHFTLGLFPVGNMMLHTQKREYFNHI